MDGTDLRDYQASPGTDAEASISSDGVSGKGGKMPSQGGEIMDIEYFSDHAEGKKKRRRGRLIIFGASNRSPAYINNPAIVRGINCSAVSLMYPHKVHCAPVYAGGIKVSDDLWRCK